MHQAKHSIAFSFPGGGVVKARPSKVELKDSAVAWLTMAQSQIGSVRYWADLGDRTEETIKALDVLRSQLEHARRALAESEHAK